jgi:hypothetical protein
MTFKGAMPAMGDGEQPKENHGDAVDGWFDLLDDSIMSEALKRSSARPPSAGRPANGHNLSGLNEISNKITPVMLAPVHHLLPIEPSHPSSEPRDVWETDPNETTSSFEIVGALDQSVPSDSLPPLQDVGERGDGFLDFSDPPPMSRRTRNFDQATDGPSFEAGSKRASHMRSSSPPEASNDDESFAGLDPDSIPASTPLSNTLFAKRDSPPAAPAVEEEDAFDLSDFDRWGRDDEAPVVEVRNDAVSSIAEDPHDFDDPPAPVLALERDPFEADSDDIDGLLSGGAFASPPDDETFAEAVTRPRIEIPESLRGGPVRPSLAPVDPPHASAEVPPSAHVPPPPLPRQGPPPLPPRQRTQPTPATPVRPIPAVAATPSTPTTPPTAPRPSSIPRPSLPPVRPSTPVRS